MVHASWHRYCPTTRPSPYRSSHGRKDSQGNLVRVRLQGPTASRPRIGSEPLSGECGKFAGFELFAAIDPRRSGQAALTGARLQLGDTASEQSPDDADIRTCAFPESARAPRHGVAVGTRSGCGRLLSVDPERPVQAAVMTKASVDLVDADARVRGQALARSADEPPHRAPANAIVRSAGSRCGSGPSPRRQGDRARRGRVTDQSDRVRPGVAPCGCPGSFRLLRRLGRWRGGQHPLACWRALQIASICAAFRRVRSLVNGV